MPDADPSTWVTPEQIAATIAALCSRTPPPRAAPTSPSTERPEPMATPARDRRRTRAPTARAAGSTSAGRRSRRWCSTTRTRCSAAAAQETPREGGPEAVVDALVATMQRGARDAGVAGERARRDRRRHARRGRRRGGHRRERAQPARLDRPVPARARELSRRLGGRAACASATTSTSRSTASTRSAPGRGHDSILGVWWGTGVGGGLVLGGEMWHGRGYAGEFGPPVVRRGGAPVRLREPRLRRGLRRPQDDGGVGAREAGRGPRTPTSSRSWRSASRDRLTSGVWWRARARRGPARAARGRARAEGARRRASPRP